MCYLKGKKLGYLAYFVLKIFLKVKLFYLGSGRLAHFVNLNILELSHLFKLCMMIIDSYNMQIGKVSRKSIRPFKHGW